MPEYRITEEHRRQWNSFHSIMAKRFRPLASDDLVDVQIRGTWNVEDPIDAPERPCARCGNDFQPTVRRRVLCFHCFKTADPGGLGE